MPSRRRGSSGFRGVRARLNGTFYAEIRAGGFHVTLGTFNTPELAAHAYEAATWRFRRSRRDLNFQDIESLEEAEFLVPAPRRASSARTSFKHLQQRRNNLVLQNQFRARCKYLARVAPKSLPSDALFRSAGDPLKKRPQRKR
ncbi:ethylene-responsive transcription factor 1-like [Lolium perenne]|uniref:ethylene-responsive transcription factor 1-like n=1 Tax=Lolium perenne TaxID=4522 RepID=UPI0021F57E28|nr:ethylene-responsive transcription factor 1-like [Lolium perenne]